MNKVALLAGVFSKDSLFTEVQGKYLIDWQIDNLISMGKEVYVILDQYTADDIIRKSKSFDLCEMVYDTNDHSNFYTNFRSALYITQEACFVQPVNTPIAEKSIWNKIQQTYFKFGTQTNHHMIQAHQLFHGEIKDCLPLLVTPNGNQFLRRKDVLESLKDPSIYIYNCLVKNSKDEPLRL